MAVRQHAVLLFSEMSFAPEKAAIAMSALSAATIVGQILAGASLDRSSHARWVTAGFSIFPLLGVLAFAVGPHSLAVMVIASVFIGIGSGSEMGFLPYLVGRYFGIKSYAEIQGYMLIVITLTLGLSPVIIGALHDKLGSYDLILKALDIVLLMSTLLFLPCPAIVTRNFPRKRPLF